MANKQYDFSDFDKQPEVSEKTNSNYDFSDFEEPKDLLQQEQVAPQQQIEQPSSVEDTGPTQLLTPTGGSMYKATSTITKDLPENILKAGEIAAQKIGGLTPEQTEYYKQNYKAMEASGMSPEAIQESFSKLENVFKQKNIQANQARKLAEQSLEVPLTKKLMKEAASKSLPRLMDKIDTEKEAFQEVAKERVTKEVESEATRLANLLEEKKLALQEASELAQSRAEKAADIAVKKATPKKKLGLVKEPQIDTTEVYNKAFDEELSKALPEQEKRMTSLIKEYTDAQKRMVDLQNEYFVESEISPKVRKQIIREEQTKLASEFPSVRGYQDVKGLGSDVKKLLEPYTDVTQFEGERAAEELRNIRKKAFGKDATVKDEAAKALQEELRQLLAPAGSTSDVEYKRVSNLLNQLKQAQTEGFITRRTGEVIPGNIDLGEEDEIISKFSPESIEVGQKEQQYIRKVLNPSAKDMQNVDIQQGRKVFDDLVANPKLVEEVKQAAIKMDLLDPTKAAKFGATDAFRILIGTSLGQFAPVAAYEGVKALKTPMGAYKAATFGTRLAEKIPQGLKTTGKILGEALPLVGAAAGGYFGYQEAKEEGLPEAAAIPYAAFEAISPIPVSPIQAKKAMEASAIGRAKNIEQNLKMSPEELEKSKQRAKAIKSFLPSWMTKKQEEVKFTSTKPEDIAKFSESLAMSDDKAAQEYGRVLNQITSSSEQQKEAILYSLNQQPAFRELVRKLKGQTEE
jgi:hypothetical protein